MSRFALSTACAALMAVLNSQASPAPVTLRITGDWTLEAALPDGSAKTTLQVAAPKAVEVTNERHESLPVFNPKTGGWAKGARLKALMASETTTPYLLDGPSLVVRKASGGESLVQGKDYDADLSWGTFGRLSGGGLGEKESVIVSYRYTPLRIDSVVLTGSGKIELRPGKPQGASPVPPALKKGERLLANIWLPGVVEKLTEDNLFPILETRYPEAAKPSPSVAEQRIPKAMARLKEGGTLRILAWGDSVTQCSYLPDTDKWQEQFVERLRKRFPKAQIELVNEAWGGRNTSSYLAEPPGALHNYKEKVLAAKPDLVISEFVNDAGLNPAQVEERYSKLLADFQGIGAEWIILTPHYTRPDWMGLKRERDVDQDPRPYVKGLREFSAKHNVALADAALRYGRLWRQGIPYSTWMVNSINHPNRAGMALFADALMELFP